MRLTVLGSGTCVPSLERGAPAYHIETAEGVILVDCGSGTLRQLLRAGKSYKDIDAVFITHSHPDHISDLMPLIHALVATPEFKRSAPLYIVGPKSVGDFYEGCILSLMRSPRDFTVETVIAQGKLFMLAVDIYTCKTLHSHDSIAYRFEDSKGVVVITGDCDYDDSLAEFSSGADLLIADCSFPDGMKAPGHLTPSECGMLARKAGVKHLVLSHFYPVKTSDEEILNQCRSHFKGRITLAEDFMEFTL